MSRSDGKKGCVDEATLVEYLRGEFEGAESDRLREHLLRCETCARIADGYNAVITGLARLPQPPPIRDLSDDIRSRLAREDERRLHLHVARKARVALTAAAAVLVAAGIWVAVKSVLTSPAPTDETSLALRWLAASQEPDGSWNPVRWGGQETYRVGLTGLALLAFTGGESDVKEGRRGVSVERATQYLLSQQESGGRFGPFFSAMLYNHGIATAALLERYQREGDPALKEPIGRALGFITQQQQDDGGWGYLQTPANTSITSWQLQALLLGAGLDWPTAGPAARRGLSWVRATLDAEGRAGYTKPGDFPYGSQGLTAMAALCIAMGERGSVRADGDGGVFHSLVEAASAGVENHDFVRSYFLANALSVAALDRDAVDPELARLSAELRRAVADRQIKSGPDAGSWDPSDRWGPAGGRVYATAMGVLSLRAGERARRLAEPGRARPR